MNITSFKLTLTGILCLLLTIPVYAQDPNLEAIYSDEDIIHEDYELEMQGELLSARWSYPDAGHEGRPLVVLIHGGGFLQGSTFIDILPLIPYFNNRGYITMVVEYRRIENLEGCENLSWWWAIQDVNAWIKWAVWKKSTGAPAFNFDPNNVILFGSSAGAVTALTLTYTDDTDLQQIPSAYSQWGGLDATCIPGTETFHYKIKGTVSACGAIPNYNLIPTYDFNENTAIYFLHGINDGAVPETDGIPNACLPGAPNVHLFGPAHLLANNTYHTSYTPPASPEISASPIYSHRFYVKNYGRRDHNYMSDTRFHAIPPGDSLFLPKALVQSPYFVDATGNQVGFQNIVSWVWYVATSGTASNNQKSGSATGIDQTTGDYYQLELVPNPAHGRFNVSLRSTVGQSTYLQIFNSLGQEVYSRQVNLKAGRNMISVDKVLPTGLYFTKIKVDGQWLTRKLIVSSE